MSHEPFTDPPGERPLPVLPLDYAAGQNEPLRKILRLMAWMFVLWQISSVAHCVSDVGCFVWEQSDRGTLRKLLKPNPLLIELPSAIVSFYLLANAPAMLSLSDKGRRWIRGGAITKAIINVLVNIGLAINAVVDRRVFWYGPAYGTNVMIDHFWSMIFTLIEYAIFYRLFAEHEN
jgi:hypothetical protein